MRTFPLLLLLSTAALAQGLPPYPRPVRNVVAYPPDGGALVTIGQAVVPITCNQPDGGTCVLDVQGRGGGNLYVQQQGSVEVTGLSGGQVDVKVPSGVAITNSPAVTVSSGSVTVSGTVGLNASSLATITAAAAERICTYAVGDPDSLSFSTTPENVPASPLTGRTALTIWNFETIRAIWCNPTGTATATAAVPIVHGASLKLEGLDGTTVISCRCSTSTCAYAYLEEKCYQPTP